MNFDFPERPPSLFKNRTGAPAAAAPAILAAGLRSRLEHEPLHAFGFSPRQTRAFETKGSGHWNKIESFAGLNKSTSPISLNCASPGVRKTGRPPGGEVTERIKSQPSHLATETFQVIADWYHLAILELIELEDRFQSCAELSKVLKVPLNRVKQAIERLIKTGLLAREDGRLTVKESATFTGDEMPSAAIRQSHMQVLGLCKVARRTTVSGT